MLIENNDEVKKMVTAMSDITDASHRIETIIKAIEDIAFQTNILALNAAVEAARAGAAGKGFAVVADEVRNLATKSAEAAKNTSDLIHTSIEAVDRGTSLAMNVADRMTDVIEISRESSEHAKYITALTESQASSAASVKEKMSQISIAVARNSENAVESSEVARSVADEIRRMNDIVNSQAN
ncbi:MAG: methyl-accepting chemotaxis protein [Ruminococcus sp.]|nr:methyl-accepting chemotaxis protein [Ruminococcus sp.]